MPNKPNKKVTCGSLRVGIDVFKTSNEDHWFIRILGHCEQSDILTLCLHNYQSRYMYLNESVELVGKLEATKIGRIKNA